LRDLYLLKMLHYFTAGTARHVQSNRRQLSGQRCPRRGAFRDEIARLWCCDPARQKIGSGLHCSGLKRLFCLLFFWRGGGGVV
jgi:hypothetical protein